MIYKVRFLLPKKNLLKKNFDFYFINSILLYNVIIVIQQTEAERQNQNDELDQTTERLE